MNRRCIILGLWALLCATQVCCKPSDDKIDDSVYPEDDAELEDNEDAYDDSEGQGLSSAPVQLLTQSQYFQVEAGSDVYLPCNFVNADNVMINWEKGAEVLFAGDAKLSQNNRLHRLQNNTLFIHNALPEDSSDNYKCKALEKNEHKNVVHRLLVKESTSPSVRILPYEYIELEQGQDLHIGCEVLDDQRPKAIAWSREGHRLKVDKETPTAVFISIRNATRHLAGDYQCLVETGAAKPIIKHLKLRVKHIPDIEYEKVQSGGERMREVDSYYTGLGTETNITCVVHSHPPMTKLHWLKDGHKINHDSRVSKSSSHKSQHVLTIKDTTKSDLGVYQCRAWNALGNATGPPINLRDTPDQPVFQSGQVIDDSIQFQWRVISYKPIVQAEIMYRKKGEQNWQEGLDEKVVSSVGKLHVVQGRISGIPAGTYEVKLRTRNDEEHADGDKLSKWGPFSDPEKFDGEYKDAEVKSVTGSAMKPTISFMTLLFMISQLAYSYS
ncbi:PREDICTED: muscle M-line assembly protein unc-89-like [Ceratosolen solmsi marchali]|uniref:Muscle M-line assembly protein unc-89-like n=1 Tax=Ceratosolen solmsi marchali TaxID=326594 RepID=A0AAJ6YB68_9HYME|nr:PREDICTED: muscle M-line assembly protein unc-89-like [Ceratosolen solmsi marchali]